MNRMYMEQLLTHLDTIPEDQFQYDRYLGVNGVAELDYNLGDVNHKPIPECQTAGCVVGHAYLLFGLNVRAAAPTYYDMQDTATRFLELTRDEEHFLFHENTDQATAQDAVKRIRWLLAGNAIDNYPWHEESYHVPE